MAIYNIRINIRTNNSGYLQLYLEESKFLLRYLKWRHWICDTLLEPQYVFYQDKRTKSAFQHPPNMARLDLQDRQMKDGDMSSVLRKLDHTSVESSREEQPAGRELSWILTQSSLSTWIQLRSLLLQVSLSVSGSEPPDGSNPGSNRTGRQQHERKAATGQVQVSDKTKMTGMKSPLFKNSKRFPPENLLSSVVRSLRSSISNPLWVWVKKIRSYKKSEEHNQALWFRTDWSQQATEETQLIHNFITLTDSSMAQL